MNEYILFVIRMNAKDYDSISNVPQFAISDVMWNVPKWSENIA